MLPFLLTINIISNYSVINVHLHHHSVNHSMALDWRGFISIVQGHDFGLTKVEYFFYSFTKFPMVKMACRTARKRRGGGTRLNFGLFFSSENNRVFTFFTSLSSFVVRRNTSAGMRVAPKWTDTVAMSGHSSASAHLDAVLNRVLPKFIAFGRLNAEKPTF